MEPAARSAAIDLFQPVRLGRSAVEVSRIGLGLREIGRDPVRTRNLIMRAAQLGVRHFDVAPTYGVGIAERRLGEALPVLGRDSVVISTKVGQLLRPPHRGRRMVHALTETVTGGREGLRVFGRRARRVVYAAGRRPRRASGGSSAAGWTGGRSLVETCDYSYDGVMRGLEESLARLATDRVDVVLIHDPDLHHGQAMRGAYRALDALRRVGTIGAVGVGMNQAQALVRFAGEGDFDAFLIAGRYTLLDQTAADRLLPIAAAQGISIIAAGVFNGGILADPSPGAVFDYAPASEDRLRQAQRRKQVCDRYGVSIKAAALQFPLAHPAVSSLLLGATSADQLDECVRLLQTPTPPELWMALRAEGLIGRVVPVPA